LQNAGVALAQSAQRGTSRPFSLTALPGGAQQRQLAAFGPSAARPGRGAMSLETRKMKEALKDTLAILVAMAVLALARVTLLAP
jgi:hypothetical protein